MRRPKKTAENNNNNNNNNNKLNYNKTNNSYRRRQHINSYSSASTWYDATVCKYTCISFLIFSACCSICIIGITFSLSNGRNTISSLFYQKKSNSYKKYDNKYTKAVEKEFKNLKTTLLEIEKKEANKLMWNGPALPKLVRLRKTTTIESRTIPITKVPISTLTEKNCKSTKFYFLKDTDMPGMDVNNGLTKNGVKVDTAEKCCELCTKEKDCEAFTWITDGHDCWLKRSVDKVTLGKKNLISGMTVNSYNLNVKDQKLYEEALNKVATKPYKGGELFWPKIDQIHVYNGKPRQICDRKYNNLRNLVLVVMKNNDLGKGSYEDITSNDDDLIRRAFKRHKILLCSNNEDIGHVHNDEVAVPHLDLHNKSSGVDPAVKTNHEVYGTRIIDKIVFDKNVVTHYEKNDGNQEKSTKRKNVESYSIKMTGSSTAITITAPTAIGFLHGLQRISQFCASGVCNVTDVNIVDRPQYVHRGLLLDVGRRYIPIPALYMILDGMAALHMNTFHWHLTDWAAVRFETHLYPELNTKKRFYGKDDITNVVKYALDRGISVYPELDVPGHANCFVPANGADNNNNKDKSTNNAKNTFQFCDKRKFELFNDPEGKTVSGIKKLLKELGTLFPDTKYIHIGGDETEDKGKCNKKNFAELTKTLQKEIFNVHNKKPIVWNEVVNVLKAGVDQTIIQAWSKTVNFTELLVRNHPIIFSQYEKMYLDFTSTSCNLRDVASGKECLWVNISYAVEDPMKQHLILGGEATMWTDEYCPHSKCVGQGESWGSHVDWLFEEKEDLHFSQNFLSIIFPRLNAVAGSFWNFDKNINTEMFLRRYYNSYYHVNNRIKYVAPSAHATIAESNANSGGGIENPNIDKRYSSIYNICPINNCDGCTMTHRCGKTWKEYFKQFGAV